MSEHYWIMGSWGLREESFAEQGGRIRRTIERLSLLHPLMRDWRIPGATAFYDFSAVKDRIDTFIPDKVVKDDDGKPVPSYGYRVSLDNYAKTLSPSRVDFSAFMGTTFLNWSGLSDGVSLGLGHLVPETKTLITLDNVRQAMWILASEWSPQWMVAQSTGLNDVLNPVGKRRPYLGAGWITYICSDLAPLVPPPSSSANEFNPDGSLFMIASREPFRAEDPLHMAVARDVDAAMAPIQSLPWPPGPNVKPGAFR